MDDKKKDPFKGIRDTVKQIAKTGRDIITGGSKKK
jgi:hypothetical protein